MAVGEVSGKLENEQICELANYSYLCLLHMAEGDDMFSEESITAVETVLTEYVQRLCEAVHKKNATTVYNSMGKLVKKLNKINDKYGLIETMEREELCEWMNIIIRKTGLELEDNVDITDEYREW